MRLLYRVTSGITALFSRTRQDVELDDEFQAFMDASIAAKVARGMSPEEAARAARIELGSRAAVKDWTRDVGWERHVESVWQDVRYAARMLWRAPGHSLTAIVTLAIGLGATAAMYAVIDAVLLKPLPYPQPGNVLELRLRQADTVYGVAAGTIEAARQLPSIEYAAGVVGAQHTMSGADLPLLVSGEASPATFSPC